MLSVALRKARTLATFSFTEIALLVPVFLLLGGARLAILLLPFRIYARQLGAETTREATPQALNAKTQKRAKRIGRVVRSVAKITPWASLCLAQAMTASFLLRRTNVPYLVFFGLAPSIDGAASNPLDAHAWVVAGDMTLTGGGGLDRFTVVKVFESRSRPPR